MSTYYVEHRTRHKRDQTKVYTSVHLLLWTTSSEGFVISPSSQTCVQNTGHAEQWVLNG